MRQLSAVAAVGLVLACPVWVWWVIGPLDADFDDLDYYIRPPELPPGLEPALGITGIAVAVVCGLVLVVATCLEWFDWRWWQVIGPLVLAGMGTGYGWRILTAGGIGANIGAGFVMFFGVPALVATLVWALVRSVLLVRQTHRHRS
ncbi:hypothetical protein DMB38_34805 [Streptomyces sp. WAC 06738]|uniref:hypothetical protein n=1 Tax=Streptomyces sp. WAC 06738 TaxID=2203210 RepID=UPI000F6D5878|nr:hypothetical protein [Streptomyces sp. WAC 06738]AZM50265.1 hypothetical protein DMB38_34805 [Streptomyces sp. WAC 06738]